MAADVGSAVPLARLSPFYIFELIAASLRMAEWLAGTGAEVLGIAPRVSDDAGKAYRQARTVPVRAGGGAQVG